MIRRAFWLCCLFTVSVSLFGWHGDYDDDDDVITTFVVAFCSMCWPSIRPILDSWGL